MGKEGVLRFTAFRRFEAGTPETNRRWWQSWNLEFRSTPTSPLKLFPLFRREALPSPAVVLRMRQTNRAA